MKDAVETVTMRLPSDIIRWIDAQTKAQEYEATKTAVVIAVFRKAMTEKASEAA